MRENIFLVIFRMLLNQSISFIIRTTFICVVTVAQYMESSSSEVRENALPEQTFTFSILKSEPENNHDEAALSSLCAKMLRARFGQNWLKSK